VTRNTHGRVVSSFILRTSAALATAVNYVTIKIYYCRRWNMSEAYQTNVSVLWNTLPPPICKIFWLISATFTTLSRQRTWSSWEKDLIHSLEMVQGKSFVQEYKDVWWSVRCSIPGRVGRVLLWKGRPAPWGSHPVALTPGDFEIERLSQKAVPPCRINSDVHSLSNCHCHHSYSRHP